MGLPAAAKSARISVMENNDTVSQQILAELKESNRHLKSFKMLLGITIALCVVMAVLDVVISGILKR